MLKVEHCQLCGRYGFDAEAADGYSGCCNEPMVDDCGDCGHGPVDLPEETWCDDCGGTASPAGTCDC